MRPPATSDDIAIVGVSCRFPSEADTAQNFWDFICKGRNAYSENADRWTPDAFHYGERKLNTSLPRGGHFLKQDVAAFDATFFNMSKAEAESMDPQQRMILEVTYESMESAGLRTHHLAGSQTGVFMASFTSDYREMLYRDPETVPLYTATGTSNTSTSNRVSWFFDLHGPSFTVNTACSSSLVACHLACQSLSAGETEAAIVGGTSLLLNPDMFLYLSNQQFLAPNGQCKSFDESGDGYARGDGIGVVILKRVADAIRDGDPIRAVIRGSGCNQDGHTKGFTVPSVEAQAQLIIDTYQKAGLPLTETRYVEAHGTGTQAGDTRETEGLSRTFGKHRTASDKLLVGSVKANIGHLEACAGLASLIKCIYILETGFIPPTPSGRKLNPKIPWQEWHLHVPTTQTPWPTHSLRRVSTQGFGYGGTNAHIILDDAAHYLQERNLVGHHYTRPRIQATGSLRPAINGVQVLDSIPHLFILQAQDREGLKRLRTSLTLHLRRQQKLWKQGSTEEHEYLRDLAFTLASRRSNLQWQTFGIASTSQDLIELLNAGSWPNPETRRTPKAPRLGFIFTGQGAQWARMGVELMAYPVFRQSVEESGRFLTRILGCSWSAVDELSKPQGISRLGEAAYSQTLCSVLQIGLVDLLEDWNILPERVAGHSSGEIAAAYCLGALSKHDALRVAYYRGGLSTEMQQNSKKQKGAMMAIGESPKKVSEWLGELTKGEVVIACVNSPSSVTASGDAAGVDELLEIVQGAGVFGRKLQVDVAYHSPHMQPVAGPYFEFLADLDPQPARPGRTMHSSVLGGPIDADELGASNWVRNLTSPVLFSEAVSSLLYDDDSNLAVDLLVEIGPHSALKGPVQQTLKSLGVTSIGYLNPVARKQDAVKTTLACAGELLISSFPVAIARANQQLDSHPRPLVDLPPYPWNHSTRFWAESRLSKQYRLRKHPRMPLLGSPCPTMGAREQHWRGMIQLSEEPWIRDHQIQGAILYPGAGFLSMVIEAAVQQADERRTNYALRLRDIHFDAALVVPPEDGTVEAILQLRPHLPAPGSSSSTWMEFTVNSSIDGGPLRQNCSGLIMVEYAASTDSPMHGERILQSEMIQQRYKEISLLCRQTVDVSKFYSRLAAMGLTYGPSFSNVTAIQRAHGGQCVGSVCIPTVETMVPPAYRSRPHIVHPGTLDAIFHLAFAALEDSVLPRPMVPTAIDEVVILADIPHSPGVLLEGVAKSSPHGFREMVSDIHVLSEGGNKAVLQINGFKCSEVSGTVENTNGSAEQETRPISFRLDWKPAVDLLNSEELSAYISSASAVYDTTNRERVTNLEARARQTATDILSSLPATDIAVSPLQSFLDWLKAQSGIATNALVSNGDSVVAEDQHALEEILAGVLQGYITLPLSPEQQDGVLRQVEESGALSEILHSVDAYLTLRHHTKPNLSVLELSPDTVPYSLFAALPSYEVLLGTAQYSIHVSKEDAVGRVKRKIGAQQSAIEISVANFEEEPRGASVNYDVILVFDPGYTSMKTVDVLRYARRLLNPGGSIVIVEVTKPGLYLGMALGSLQWTKCFNTEGRAWESNLSAAGLTRNVVVTKSKPSGHTSFNLLVSDGGSDMVNGHHREQTVTLVESSNPSVAAQSLVAALAQRLMKASIPTQRFCWGSDVSQLKRQPCIVLTDLEKALLKDPSAHDLAVVQFLLSQADSVLWVSGPLGVDSALMTGLARSVRNEVVGLQLQTLEFANQPIFDFDSSSDLIARVWKYKGSDNEFVATNGSLQVGRFVEDDNRNTEIAQLLGRKERPAASSTLDEKPQALKLCVRQIGMLDSLCYEPDPLAAAPLEHGELEVDVKASGINFRDVMVALGQIPDRSFGFEGAGIVRRVHSGETRFKPGDRVVFRAQGAHRTVHRVPADYTMPLADTMAFEEGASLLLVHTTAWYGLVKIARATAGQSVLIHAAAGGVGQAALMLAQYLRLEIFATVGSEEKRKLIHETYNISNDHIFNSRDLSFTMGIKRMTKGRGVDIVLNSLAGEALRQTWYCLAPFGTFVEIGMKDIMDNMRLDMKPFNRDATFAFFNFNHIEKARPDLMIEALRETMSLVYSGALRPVTPLTAYPASQVEAAFRQIQTGHHLGKLVLTFPTGGSLPVLQSDVSLSNAGTYLLVGGFGGLGRSLARLLVRLGARKLCFLSRSGANSHEACALIEELETQHDVRTLIYKGDVADPAVVADAVKQCTTKLGPIQGVIQCAMILRDALFEKLTHEQWTQSTRPKVQGTSNLHEQVPLSAFLITLSSFAGVFGNRGQSNYAAAGAYEDALAYHCNKSGRRAITIDLGIMRDIGVIAESGVPDNLREWEEPFGIRELEFHALIKSAIADALQPVPQKPVVQIPTGLATARSAQAAGISPPFYFDDARFSILAQLRTSTASSSDAGHGQVSARAQLSQAQSVAEAATVVQSMLLGRVAKSLQSTVSEIDASRPLHSYGVDSLVAIETVKWVFQELQAKLTVFDILANVPITVLCEKIASMSALVKLK